MKKFIVLTGLILFIACSGSESNNQSKDISNANNPKTEKERFEECSINGNTLLLNPISESEYKKLLKKVKRVKIAKVVNNVKQNGKLTLPLKDGNSKVLLDNKSDNEVDDVNYSIIGKIEPLNLYVVNVSYYETSECILIDMKTGEENKIWGEPIISPDFKHLFSYGDALGYDVMPNGIQMWKFEDGKLNIDWELKPEEWKPQSIEWLNENTLLFMKVIPKEFSQGSKDVIEYVKLTIK